MDIFGVQGGPRQPQGGPWRPRSGPPRSLSTHFGTPWVRKGSKNGFCQRSLPSRVDFGSILGSALGPLGAPFGFQILVLFQGAPWVPLRVAPGVHLGPPRASKRGPKGVRKADLEKARPWRGNLDQNPSEATPSRP